MPISESSSRETLETFSVLKEHRHTGWYIVGGGILGIILLTLHQVLLRDASTIAGICIPTIIMGSYIIWVLYSARRDKLKARRLASAMQLTEVISTNPSSNPSESTTTITTTTNKYCSPT